VGSLDGIVDGTLPPPDGAVGSLDGIVDGLAGIPESSLAQRGSEGDFLHNALSALGDRGFLVGELDCANT
jgi:hypothetical protein